MEILLKTCSRVRWIRSQFGRWLGDVKSSSVMVSNLNRYQLYNFQNECLQTWSVYRSSSSIAINFLWFPISAYNAPLIVLIASVAGRFYGSNHANQISCVFLYRSLIELFLACFSRANCLYTVNFWGIFDTFSPSSQRAAAQWVDSFFWGIILSDDRSQRMKFSFVVSFVN